MITIPTGELTGLIADVLPFALRDDDIEDLCCVRLEWDGEMLHAYAQDLSRLAWSQWHPDDPPPGDDQDMLGVEWGGADDSWSLTMPLRDAKEIVNVFKLPRKEQNCPLTLDLIDGRLKVARSRETSRSALVGIWQDAELAVRSVRAELARWDRVQPVRSVAFTACLLADFECVRARGPLRLTFTGEETPTLVEIGERFVGAIMPTRTDQRRSRLTSTDGREPVAG